MSAGDRRSPRWEIVQTAAGWHARFIASNGRTILSSEVYQRRRAAVRAIDLVTGEPVVDNGHGLEVASKADPVWLLLEVRAVDERPPPPPPVVIEWPVYKDHTAIGVWWHDSEAHNRQCFYSDCTEATPPQGEFVTCRLGLAKAP